MQGSLSNMSTLFDYKIISSLNPCSDTHAGPTADSEIETKSVEKAINDKLGQWDAFITIHSYGNFWQV